MDTAGGALVEPEPVLEGGRLQRVSTRVVRDAQDAGVADDGVQDFAAARADLQGANRHKSYMLCAVRQTWTCPNKLPPHQAFRQN